MNKSYLIITICMLVLAGCEQNEQKGAIISKPSAPSASKAAPLTATATGTRKLSGEVYEGTISGVISDSMCGKDHSKMSGTDPAACTAKCIASGAKYVLVDAKGDVYQLSDQETPKDYAGKTVTIKGHIDPSSKAIHVHSLTGK